jgi:hypothetical protein
MLFHQFCLKCLGKQKLASPGVMPLCSSFINNPAIGCMLQELKAIWWVAVGLTFLVAILI